MPGGRGGGASSDSDRPQSGCQGLQRILLSENTTYCQLRTFRGHRPDDGSQFPDSVRGPGRPLPARFGRTIAKRGGISARGTEVSEITPCKAARRRADDHCSEYSNPKK